MASRNILRFVLVWSLPLMLGLTAQPFASPVHAASPPQGPINGDYQNGQQPLVVGLTPYHSPVLDTSNGNSPYINQDITATILTDPAMATGDCSLTPWDPTAVPGPSGGNYSNPAWWSYTAPANGSITADTFGSNYDTAIAVYTLVNNPPTVASDFVEAGCDNNVNGQETSLVHVSVTAGVTYYILVAAASSNNSQTPGVWGGNLEFHVHSGSLAAYPINQTAVEGHELLNKPIATLVDTDRGSCTQYSATVTIQGSPQTVSCSGPTPDLNMSCSTFSTDTVCTVYATHTYSEEQYDNLDVVFSDLDGDTYELNTANFDAPRITVADAQLAHVQNGTGADGLSAPQPAVEGTPVSTFLGTFTDAAGISQDGLTQYCDIGDFTAKVDWGDSDNNLLNAHETITSAGAAGDSIVPSTHHPGPCTFDVYGTHTYVSTNDAAPLARSITLTVFDVGLGAPCFAAACTPSVNLSANALVTDAPAIGAAATAQFPALEGQQFAAPILLGTVTDTDPACPVESLDIKVDWGDGSTADNVSVPSLAATNGSITYTLPTLGVAPCTYSIYGLHTYPEESAPKAYPIAVSGDIQGGAKWSFSTSALVSDSALNYTTDPSSLTPLTNATEGASVNRVFLGTFHDSALNLPGTPNPDAPTKSCDIKDYSATVNWGDAAANPGQNTTVLTSANGGIQPSTDGVACDFDLFGSYTYKEEGAYTLTITTVDAGGAPAIVGTDSITVDDAPLTLVSVNAPTANEGIPMPSLVLGVFHDTDPNCLASDYTVTGNWGDSTSIIGVGTDISIHYLGSCDFQVDGLHTYAEEKAAYLPNITITDHLASIALTNASVSVLDSPLNLVSSATLSGLTESVPSGTLNLGQFKDANPGCDPVDLSASVDWGDGSSSTGTIANVAGCTFSVSGTHTYAEDSSVSGPYKVRVTVTDVGGSTLTIADSATVADAVLSATPGTSPGGTTESGQVVNQNLGTFSDANSNCPIGDFTATIGWGDGKTSLASASTSSITTSATPCVFNVIGTHTYYETGNFTVTVTVNDVGGSSTQWTFVWSVIGDATLTTVQQNVTLASVEGSPLTNAYLGEFHDTDPHCAVSDYKAVVSWNVGSIANPQTTLTSAGGGIVDTHDGLCDFKLYGTYTYPVNGTYPISVTVTDGDPATTTLAATANIGEAPLSTTPLVSTYTVTEGAPDTNRLLGTVHDADPACNANNFDPANGGAIAINWGDGSAPDTSTGTVAPVTPGSCTFSVYGSHTFSEETTSDGIPVVVTISDEGSASATITDTVIVRDAPLSGSPGTPVAVEGRTMLPGAATILGTITDADPGCQITDYKVSLLWNDAPIADHTGYLTAVSPGSCTFNLYSTGHVFLEEGNNSVIATVTDAGGSTVQYTTTVVTADAPLQAVAGAVNATEGASFSGALGQFKDTDPGCALSDYTIDSVNWGDGTGLDTTASHFSLAPAGNCVFTVSASHTFGEQGTFPITIQAHDAGGSAVTISSTANVADAALSTLTTVTLHPVEGQAFSNVLLGTFSDADPDCGPASAPVTTDYAAAIDWGDGTPLDTSSAVITRVSGCTFQVTGSHLYHEQKTFAIKVTVTDAEAGIGGSSTVINDSAVVSDAPVVGLSNIQSQFCTLLTSCGSTTLGDEMNLGRIASFHDTSTTCMEDFPNDYTVSINWGDSTTVWDTTSGRVQSTGSCNFDVYGRHTYTAPNGNPGYTITVRIYDTGQLLFTTSAATDTASVIRVGVPANSPHTSSTPNSLSILYNYPSLLSPTYVNKTTLTEYNNGQVFGNMTFKDMARSLGFNACTLTTGSATCYLTMLSYTCTTATPRTARVWAKYQIGSRTATPHYFRMDAVNAGSFKLITQDPSNPIAPISSSPPTTPVATAVKVSCTP